MSLLTLVEVLQYIFFRLLKCCSSLKKADNDVERCENSQSQKAPTTFVNENV